jgi:type I restriction enzyme S subunit
MELNDAGIWGSGGTPSRKNPRYYENGTIPWLVIGDLNDQAVEEFSTSITELGLVSSSAKIIPPGSLLVAMYGSIGKLGITTFPCTTNQAIAFCIPNEELVSLRYLFHALANAKSELIAKGQGGAQQNISQGILKEHPISLAPLNEQRRIAAKLDTALAAVEACRQRLDGVAAILKRFRQAVLAAATSGELTREWREERGDFSHWQEKSLAELGVFGRGRSRHRPRNDPRLYGGDYPFVQTGDVANAKGDWLTAHSQTYSSFGLAQSRIWPRSTLCITIAANIADTALLEYPACFPDSVVGFVADREQVEPLFAKWMIDSVADKLESFAPATAQKNINLAILDQIVFSVPLLQEQTEIISRAKQLFTLAGLLEARLTAARKIVDRLNPALLAKAFRGELVPQDPNDEPASVLLEQIRASRQEGMASGKPTRPRRRNAHTSITKTTALTNMLTRDNVQVNHLSAILKECGPLSAEALWSASQLEIDDFYTQLRDEEAQGFLLENRGDSPDSTRLLEPAA